MVWFVVYEEVGGFDEMVIVVEDDEFCVCLCKVGWVLKCIFYEMMFYDVVMMWFF